MLSAFSPKHHIMKKKKKKVLLHYLLHNCKSNRSSRINYAKHENKVKILHEQINQTTKTAKSVSLKGIISS